MSKVTFNRWKKAERAADISRFGLIALLFVWIFAMELIGKEQARQVVIPIAGFMLLLTFVSMFLSFRESKAMNIHFEDEKKFIRNLSKFVDDNR